MEKNRLINLIVTGGAGFIGSNFILRAIKQDNYNILNIDKLAYSGNLENLDSIKNHGSYNFIKSDIADKSIVNKAIEEFKPNAIINFAAESHVDRSIDSFDAFIDTNVLGTINLLHCAQKYFEKYQPNSFKFIHISTDEVYGALGAEGSFNENSSYNPSSPYSASKASSDHFVNSWYKTYGLPCITTNCSNNFGPYQFPEKLIPLMIINAINEKPLPIYGDGKNVRDWIHVHDHCDAIFTILNSGKIGERYNIGGDCEVENIEIVNIICKYLDSVLPRSNGSLYSSLIKYVDDRPGHDFRYAVNFDKIKNSLNWNPKIKFMNGLKDTIEWYINHSDWWNKLINNKYNLERLGKIQ